MTCARASRTSVPTALTGTAHHKVNGVAARVLAPARRG
jgi:hypothetical protein